MSVRSLVVAVFCVCMATTPVSSQSWGSAAIDEALDYFESTCLSSEQSPRSRYETMEAASLRQLTEEELSELLWGVVGVNAKGWLYAGPQNLRATLQNIGHINRDIRLIHADGRLAKALPVSVDQELGEPALGIRWPGVIGMHQCSLIFDHDEVDPIVNRLSELIQGGERLGPPNGQSARRGKGRDALRPTARTYYWNPRGISLTYFERSEDGVFQFELTAIESIWASDPLSDYDF